MTTRLKTKRKGTVRPIKPLLALHENQGRLFLLGEGIYLLQRKDPFEVNEETLVYMKDKGWLSSPQEIAPGVLECLLTKEGREIAENYQILRNKGFFQQEFADFAPDVWSSV